MKITPNMKMTQIMKTTQKMKMKIFLWQKLPFKGLSPNHHTAVIYVALCNFSCLNKGQTNLAFQRFHSQYSNQCPSIVIRLAAEIA